jgi:predicted nuclease with TOPRIM domain
MKSKRQAITDRKLSENIRATLRDEVDVEELADRVAELERELDEARVAIVRLKNEAAANGAKRKWQAEELARLQKRFEGTHRVAAENARLREALARGGEDD